MGLLRIFTCCSISQDTFTPNAVRVKVQRSLRSWRDELSLGQNDAFHLQISFVNSVDRLDWCASVRICFLLTTVHDVRK